MFDVLVYLFENYYHSDGYPDQDTLARRLTAAGFEDDEISEALDWLKDLAREENGISPVFGENSSSKSFRAFTRSEQCALGPEGLGFLTFLESAGVLSPSLRETILDRIVYLDAEPVPLEKLKVIVLMVLWTQRGNVDTLILEELLPDGAPRFVH